MDGRSGQAAAQKRIAICCDGTWRRLDGRWPTNVVRLAQAVLPADPGDGRVQLAFHLDGVGTGRGTGWAARASDRVLGGLMGLGLTEAVAEAYRLLVFAYRPGDAIFVFGYSRGAYTARSLAGMIRNCGILARAHAGRVGEALALYRSAAAADKPDGDRALAFRADYAPDVVTGDEEIAWRSVHRPGRDWSRAVPLRVAFVGVWDTVGSLGVPASPSLAGVLNRRHAFHDTCLSSRVEAARHAVAIDERRRNFLPALWDNVDTLNGPLGPGPGAPYQQRWFPGVHGAVGGGGGDTRLSSGALAWVMEGAARRGLAFDPADVAAAEAAADPLGPLSGRTARAGLLARLLALGPVDREGPAALHEVSAPALARWRADPGYRPRPLARVAGLLEGAAPPAEGAAPPAASAAPPEGAADRAAQAESTRNASG